MFCSTIVVDTTRNRIGKSDDVFIKYLIIFMKWLTIEEIEEEQIKIIETFRCVVDLVEPWKTLKWVWSINIIHLSFASIHNSIVRNSNNPYYGPYMPPNDGRSRAIDNYDLMIEQTHLLEPLILALQTSERNSMRYEEPSRDLYQISVNKLKQI